MCFIQAWVTVSLAVSSVLINQKCILNKLYLNRNTYNTGLCIDHNSVFLLRAMVHYSLIQCLWWLPRVMRIDYICRCLSCFHSQGMYVLAFLLLPSGPGYCVLTVVSWSSMFTSCKMPTHQALCFWGRETCSSPSGMPTHLRHLGPLVNWRHMSEALSLQSLKNKK